MDAPMPIATEISQLLMAMATRVAADAREAWFRDKAAVFRRIAANTVDPSTVAEALSVADEADRCADLIGGA